MNKKLFGIFLISAFLIFITLEVLKKLKIKNDDQGQIGH